MKLQPTAYVSKSTLVVMHSNSSHGDVVSYHLHVGIVFIPCDVTMSTAIRITTCFIPGSEMFIPSL